MENSYSIPGEITKKNIFSAFLSLLNVEHTESYVHDFFETHPYKNNLYGLSKMLDAYNIPNMAIKVNKEKYRISDIEVPFIAYTGNSFVLMTEITDSQVKYIWNHVPIATDLEKFHEQWSGIALIAEPDKNSVEPNIKDHKKLELFKSFERIAGIFSVLVVVALVMFINRLYTSFSLMSMLGINLLGLYVSYLLIRKHLKFESRSADKICSLFKQSDCNDVLDSPAAKLFGLVSWSEIGFAYFFSNLMVLLLFPSLLSYVVLFNICALPFTIWSVWYQAIKVKLWCPLCLIIQCILWLLFITAAALGLVHIIPFQLSAALLFICIYIIIVVCINMILPLFAMKDKINHLSYEIQSLKQQDEVFFSLLKKESHCKTDSSVSSILFGNKNACTQITVYTNPHCEPCGRLHKKLSPLLQKHKDKICIQLVFSSFGADYDISSRFLIAAYKNNTEENVLKIYDDWFEHDKYHKEECFDRFGYNLQDPVVYDEWNKHTAWKKERKFGVTPTILFNGYRVNQEYYSIEDLFYFIDTNTTNIEKL